RNIIETAKVAHILRARIVVFHPGYYMGRPSSACKPLVIDTLREALQEMHSLGIHDVMLGPELMGKGSQFGSLAEIIELSSELPQTRPVIDFAHYHARNNGLIKGEEDYAAIFEIIENRLGSKSLQNLHSHFSEIAYNQKGEKHHLELGTANEPPFRPLMKLCAEQGYNGTMICESPLLEQDALRMQRTYKSYSS
ncbi:MAG: TIM barrel protein, partial [Candidatus Aenigmarchaeota archaeon]|nr:TIM barrel protein [Candidatus Aenigmarchaeota archaeon]